MTISGAVVASRDTLSLTKTVNYQKVCGPYDCIRWTGEQEIEVTRVPAELSYTAVRTATGEPVTSVYWGEGVTFKAASIPPAGVPQSQIPIHPFGWTWSGDPSSIPEKTVLGSACPWNNLSCGVQLKESGNMQVSAYVNGKGFQPQIYVEVIRRKLNLDVSPGKRVKRGTTLTWTSTTDTTGATRNNLKWEWTDSSAVTSAYCSFNSFRCTQTVIDTFTMVHSAIVDDSLQTVREKIDVFTTLEIRPDKQQLHIGDTVTFTAYVDGVPAAVDTWRWSNATANELNCVNTATCTKIAVAAGTHTMSGTLSGSSASASIEVLDTCPPGHALLDRWEIRQGLVDNLKLSQTQNREIPFVIIYDSSTAGYTVHSFTGMTSWECESGVPDVRGVVKDQLSSGQRIVAWGHPHLYPPGTSYHCSKPRSNGTVVGSVVSPKGAGSKDWNAQRAVAKELGYDVPSIIINPTDVHLLNPGGRPGHERFKQPSGNKPKSQFDRTGCGWPQ